MLQRNIKARIGGNQPTFSPSTDRNNGTSRGGLSRSPMFRIFVLMSVMYYPVSTIYFFNSKNIANRESLEDLTSSKIEAVTDAIEDADSPNLRGVNSVDNANIISNSVTVTDKNTNINTNTTSEVPTYGRAAIVTKVLRINNVKNLKEWVCLINHSYNDRMKHDFVIFTTMSFKQSDIEELQKSAYPAKLTVAVEAGSLEEQVKAMTPDEKAFLYKRCNVTEGKEISWYHYCKEPGSRHTTNLGYSWQAEFRAYHIWTHPALKDYKYMMWIDADASVGTHWDIDPIKVMEDNDLTILYAGWPYGKIRNDHSVKKKLIKAYGTSICSVKKQSDLNGTHIYAEMCNSTATIHQIAGNHHITNLDVFRKDIHQKFLKDFTGDHRFSRKADDQLAVTIVGLMEQYMQNNRTDVPKEYKVWHERSHGMKLMIAHHNMYDVVKSERAPRRRTKLLNKVKDNWPGLEERCGAIIRRG